MASKSHTQNLESALLGETTQQPAEALNPDNSFAFAHNVEKELDQEEGGEEEGDDPSDNLTPFELQVIDEVDDIFFDEYGIPARRLKATRTLYGADAFRAMGLRPREHDILKRGDQITMYRKFKLLLNEYKGKGLDLDDYFWRHIKVRVWKKANIGQKTAATQWCKPAKYMGDIMDGSCLTSYLSVIRHAVKPQDYIIQLISVTLTEDLEEYVQK
jgi:hypothetical protein